MRTVISCLKLSLGNEASLSREVGTTLGELGWEPVHGYWDYIYRWAADWESEGKNLPQYSAELKKAVHRALVAHDIPYVFRTFQSLDDESPS